MQELIYYGVSSSATLYKDNGESVSWFNVTNITTGSSISQSQFNLYSGSVLLASLPTTNTNYYVYELLPTAGNELSNIALFETTASIETGSFVQLGVVIDADSALPQIVRDNTFIKFMGVTQSVSGAYISGSLDNIPTSFYQFVTSSDVYELYISSSGARISKIELFDNYSSTVYPTFVTGSTNRDIAANIRMNRLNGWYTLKYTIIPNIYKYISTISSNYSNTLGNYPIFPGYSDGLTSSFYYITDNTEALDYINLSGSQLPTSYIYEFTVPSSHSIEVGVGGWAYTTASLVLDYTASLSITSISASVSTSLFTTTSFNIPITASFTGSDDYTYIISSSINYTGSFLDDMIETYLKYAEAVGLTP